MQSETRIRCAIYARVSTDQQGESIENQISQCEEYIHRLGEQYDTSNIVIYRDEAVSGYYTSVFDRQEMKRAIQAAREQVFKLLVFKEVSRVGRDKQENPAIIGMFEQYGVRVVAINDNYDSLNKDNITFDILSVLSEQESKKISSRVSSARKQKARRGQWSGEPPIGYRIHGETQRLVIDPEYCEIPTLAFALYVHQGLGTFRVAEELNKRGYRTKNGNQWTRENVNKMLRNQAYIGHVVYGTRRNQLKREYDDTGKMSKRKVQVRIPASDWQVMEHAHEPLVDAEMFQAAQHILADRGKKGAPRRAYHPLTGLLYCGHCGKRMVCQKRSTSAKSYRYYVCSTAHKYGRGACSQPNVEADQLEGAVLDAIRKRLAQVDKGQLRFTYDRHQDLERLRGTLSAKLTLRAKRHKDQVDLFHQRELFDANTYEQQMRSFRSQLEQVDEEVNAIEHQIAALEERPASDSALHEYYDFFVDLKLKDDAEMRVLFHELLDRVTLSSSHLTISYQVHFCRE
ncbi:recombinase family protein [Paenibacillus guangzhouensis]|uniref:recombinase family protein n=1 Tax=Paenibacillus guangzhouensis TaxID=1473112 RepID=UPI0012670854|nr:recombinase family protein [Paenibacillus guangzhouensis]